MAASVLPTVRPCRQPGGPVPTDGADRPPAGRPRRWRAGWMLALSIVALLVGVLAVSGLTVHASAQPTTPSAPAPPASTTPLPESCEHNQLPYCSPSTTPAQPTTSGQPPTSTTPCAGEDCIPQPTTPDGPGAGPEQPGDGGGTGESECGISDVGACVTEAIDGMFRGIVEAALSPILELIGHTALSTPAISDLPGIGELWNNSWEIVVAAYGLLILVGGVLVMGHESVQTRYSIKEIGPRIPMAFVASALSLFFADKLIRLANGLTLGILGGGVNAPSLGDTLNDAITGILTGGLFIILVGLVLVVVGIGLLIVYVVRIVITLILIISGPLFLMCHALPHTDPLARWWWKALAATLGIQVAQALVLITAVRTFLSGGVHLFGSTLSALGMLVAAIALFYILFKIPFWLLRAVKVSSGHSFLGGLARAYIAAKTFGMVANRAGAFSKVGAAKTGSRATGSSSRGAAHPPSPTHPRPAPTPEMVGTRLQAAHDAERARAARRPRLPSQAPQFLQPIPQNSTHDPAVTPAYRGSTKPEFSSAPTPATPSPPRRQLSGSTPQFQAAGGPPRRAATPPPARPIRAASVPAQLQFRPATPPAEQPSQSVKPTSAPAAPTFRQAQPEPRIGDAYRRTHSVPPPLFRAPKPAPGGEAT